MLFLMQRVSFCAALCGLFTAGQAAGQDALVPAPRAPQVNAAGIRSASDMPAVETVTPEVWVYMQERQRYEDPKQAVRRKAEARARARQARLESRRWFGYSNARPSVSVTPFMGSYSPAWRGNGLDAYDWFGVGSTTAIYLDNSTYRR